MNLNFKEIVAAILATLAAQGGWLGVVAAFIAQYLLPLIGVNEKLDLPASVKADASAAPDEFKKAVRDYLNKLVDKIQRPLVRVVLRNILTSLSDSVLDTAWKIITGQATVPQFEATAAETTGDAGMGAAALAEVHDEIKKAGVKLDKPKSKPA